jgi:integrase
MPLSEIQIKKAKAENRAYKLSDGEGLFLLVNPNGSKLWRLKYRHSRKEKLLSFGAYPDIGIAAARQLKTLAKASLAEGKDPMVHKPGRDFEGERTFRAVAKMWHKNRESSLDTAHATRVWSRLERDVLPVLGDLMMHEISPPKVLEVIRTIEHRGALDISRRAKQGIGQIFQFAIASGMCDTDPTAHLRGALKPRPRVQHMAKLPLPQIPELLFKIDRYQEDGDRRSEITRAALIFALLTWVRTKELRFASKQEFEDLDGKAPVWRIGPQRMKMGREHIVPLSRQAAVIARAMIEKAQDDFMFPGQKPRLPLSENTMIYGLYRLGFHGRQTVHGFRGLASTWANEQLVEVGQPTIWMRRYHEDWVELQLAHSEENEVRGAYNAAEYLAPRRGMLQDWADFLDKQRGVEGKLPILRAA